MNDAYEKLCAEREQINAQIFELEDRLDVIDADISALKRWNVYDRPKATLMEEIMAQHAEALVVGINKALAKSSPFLNMLEGRRFP